jgi:hypothetical protein
MPDRQVQPDDAEPPLSVPHDQHAAPSPVAPTPLDPVPDRRPALDRRARTGDAVQALVLAAESEARLRAQLAATDRERQTALDDVQRWQTQLERTVDASMQASARANEQVASLQRELDRIVSQQEVGLIRVIHSFVGWDSDWIPSLSLSLPTW